MNESFRQSKISEASGITLNRIRKNRKMADTDVQKLHNRIKMLQMEEEKALKKIEETRKKAKQLLDIKQAHSAKQKNRVKESMTPERAEFFQNRQMSSLDRNELKEDHLARQRYLMEKKLEDISMVKKEKKELKKKKIQIEKAYLRKNQEKRMEIQSQTREAVEKIELEKKRKIEAIAKSKERVLFNEARKIKHRERQARQLELLEAEIV